MYTETSFTTREKKLNESCHRNAHIAQIPVAFACHRTGRGNLGDNSSKCINRSTYGYM